MRLGASRFVAGRRPGRLRGVLRSAERARPATRTRRCSARTSSTEAEARAAVDQYLAILDRLHAEDLRCNVALKLTHLGLDIDEELAYENVERMVEHAAGGWATSSASTWSTRRSSTRPSASTAACERPGFENVGTVLQSYLYRTPDDLESLLPLAPNLRLVKGAYLEPESVAYPRKADVDAAYLRLVERSLAAAATRRSPPTTSA